VRVDGLRGVATVVAKLFDLVKPHIAILGDKDYQQLLMIKRMAKDLNFDIEIIPGRTVREEEGERGKGEICLNGAAAKLVSIEEMSNHGPALVHVDEKKRVKETKVVTT